MGEESMGIIEERIKKRNEFIRSAQVFTSCVTAKLPNTTIIVYGSVARGDFNEWSDIDILIITKDKVPKKPTDRLDVIFECMKINPLIEPVIITLKEFYKLLNKKNPLIVEAVKKGVVVKDKLKLFKHDQTYKT